MTTTTIAIVGMVVLVLLVMGFIGYKIGTGDQKYERDTGRDFASNRDKDFGNGGFGGGHYGPGRDGGFHEPPRTRSYDEEEIVGEDEEEMEFGSDMEFPDEREPEF
jgi:hypothetical protein